jgi:hypothetical protein
MLGYSQVLKKKASVERPDELILEVDDQRRGTGCDAGKYVGLNPYHIVELYQSDHNTLGE